MQFCFDACKPALQGRSGGGEGAGGQPMSSLHVQAQCQEAFDVGMRSVLPPFGALLKTRKIS